MGIYDKQRKPIDTIVLHHTDTVPDIRVEDLSEIGRKRTYRGYRHSYHYDPITGKESFIAYHWLVFPRGLIRRCLQDNEIGWHCGNWEINCGAIGIAFVGNYMLIIQTRLKFSFVRKLSKIIIGKRG